MSIVVFWVVTPCGVVGSYQRFGGTHHLHLQGSTLKLKTVSQYRRPQSTNCNLSPIRRVQGSFPGTKRTEREADQSPSFSAEVKNAWGHTLHFTMRLNGVVLN
jgi:hypothetical protein